MSVLQATAAADRDKGSRSGAFSWVTFVGIFLVSVIYFTDIFLKASHKCFWFDELFTVYLCRLPSFTSTWSAVLHGVDFNPPLFYLLTRGAQRVFGEGLIATRLPEIVGVWLFCICLFLFVAKRAGVIAGFIAGVFPFFTLAQYYAYEARAHGIVLGWCGLALVCWQRNAEGRLRYLWLGGFGLSLLSALLTHVYAVYLLVPFALVEVYNILTRGRPNWGVLATMSLAFGSVTLAVYVPLFRVYRTNMPANFFGAAHDSFQRFMIDAIGPALMILLLSMLLTVLAGTGDASPTRKQPVIPKQEVVLAIGFICIPLIALAGSRVSHGPFFDRYFLSSIAGYAILIGLASSSGYSNSRLARAMVGCMFLLMLADVGSTFYFSASNRLMLFEPSSGIRLGTTPLEPMQTYGALSVDHGGLDILVLPSLEYLYFVKYAPPSVVSHLYYGASANDTDRGGLERLAKEARVELKTTSFGPFLATHDRFLLYDIRSAPRERAEDAAQAIARGGYRLRSAQADMEGTLYEYER
jgi:hypothetical protein